MKALKLAGLVILIVIAAIFLAGTVLRTKSGGAFADKLATPKPPLPIALTFRKALLGHGDVAVLKNNATRTVAVIVNISRPHTEGWNKSVVIDSDKFQEIGSLQGWTFAPGDTVELSADGFQPSKTILQ